MWRGFFNRLLFSASLEKKRGTAADGGGIFTEIFSFCFRFHEIIPQSAYGCLFLLPLNLPPLKREGDRHRRWRDFH